MAWSTCSAGAANQNGMSTHNSDAAWQDLQKAVQLPTLLNDQRTEALTLKEADAAITAADKAKTFYTRFPNSTHSLDARLTGA